MAAYRELLERNSHPRAESQQQSSVIGCDSGSFVVSQNSDDGFTQIGESEKEIQEAERKIIEDRNCKPVEDSVPASAQGNPSQDVAPATTVTQGYSSSSRWVSTTAQQQIAHTLRG